MPRKSVKKFNRLFGIRAKERRKIYIVPAIDPYTIYKKPKGKSKGITQGVAGWRQRYYRPQDVTLAPAKIIK
jgi:hypothetical protein